MNTNVIVLAIVSVVFTGCIVGIPFPRNKRTVEIVEPGTLAGITREEADANAAAAAGGPDFSDGDDGDNDGDDEVELEDDEDCGFRCDSGDCIEIEWRCDLTPDCAEGEDERNCDQVLAGEFRCDNGTNTIRASWRCDHFTDCQDGTDEQGCREHGHGDGDDAHGRGQDERKR